MSRNLQTAEVADDRSECPADLGSCLSAVQMQASTSRTDRDESAVGLLLHDDTTIIRDLTVARTDHFRHVTWPVRRASTTSGRWLVDDLPLCCATRRRVYISASGVSPARRCQAFEHILAVRPRTLIFVAQKHGYTRVLQLYHKNRVWWHQM